MMLPVKPERDPELLRQLGRRVQAAREAAGLSQRDFAASSDGGFSYSWLQQIESGVRPDGNPVSPKATTLIVLARQLNAALPASSEARLEEAEVLRLAGFDPEKYIVHHTGRPTMSAKQLADAIQRLPAPVREALETMVYGYTQVEELVLEQLRLQGYVGDGAVEKRRTELPGVWVGEPRPVHEPGVPIDRGSQRQKAPDSTSRGPR